MDVYDEVDRRENDAGEPLFSSLPVCCVRPHGNLLLIEVPHTSKDTTDLRQKGGRKEKFAEKIHFGRMGSESKIQCGKNENRSY